MHRQRDEREDMNENERYQEEKKQEPDGRQVQQELEDQLRAFGDTMTDAFAHGFEGRGSCTSAAWNRPTTAA